MTNKMQLMSIFSFLQCISPYVLDYTWLQSHTSQKMYNEETT